MLYGIGSRGRKGFGWKGFIEGCYCGRSVGIFGFWDYLSLGGLGGEFVRDETVRWERRCSVILKAVGMEHGRVLGVLNKELLSRQKEIGNPDLRR